jgi:hypothetical protein
MSNQKQTLIRLTANSLDLTGKQGIFEGTFNDGILINPNSQIALQSCSLSRDQDSFLVNSINNKITFNVAANKTNIIFLKQGLYDNDTLFRLLEDIQDKMNDDLDITNTKEHNTFIQVTATSQNKISINFMLGKSQSIITSPPANDPTTSGIYYSKNNGTNEIILAGSGTAQYLTGTANYTPLTGTRQYIYSNIPFNQGSGLIKIRIDRFTANPEPSPKSGAIIGLLPDTEAIGLLLVSENSNRKIAEKDYIYAICTNTDGQPASPYMIKHPQSGGVFIATTIYPQKVSAGAETTNDILMVKMTKGNIQLVIAQNGQGEEVVYEEKFVRRDSNDNLINLLPYVGIFGSAAQTRIGNSSISFNPEDNAQAGTHFEEIELAVGATPYPIPRARNTVYNLIFAKEDLANFLGFQTLEQNPSAITTPNQRYVGERELTKLFSTNTYLIEMLSEQLDSFDSFDGGRKNILAPIPLSDHVISNTGIIHYEPSNLMFINLRNDKEKLIRNIRCRIVTNAYENINIEGLAEICVLIRSM